MGYMAWLTRADNPAGDDRTTVHASQAAALYPAANLKHPDVTKAWRSDNANSAVTITVVGAAALAADLIALVNHNLSSVATVSVSAGSDATFGDYGPAAMTWREATQHLYISAGAETHRYWQITITDTGNRDGFLEIGALVMGSLYLPTFNAEHGSMATDAWENTRTRSTFGNPKVEEKYRQHRRVFDFWPLESADAAAILADFKELKQDVHPLYLIPDRAEADGYYGRLERAHAQRLYAHTKVQWEFLEDPHGRRLVRDPLIYVAGRHDLSSAGLNATFSRAGAATYVDADGVIQSAAAGAIRSGHYAERYSPVLLLERGRTNDLTYSEQFDNAAWTKVACSISANAATAPDGNTTADKMIPDSGTVGPYVIQTLPALTDDTLQPYFVHVKAAELSWFRILSRRKDGTDRNTWFDLSTGTIGTTNHTGAHMVALGDGWYRCGVIFDSLNGGTTPFVRCMIVSGDGASTVVGNASDGIYIWGAQFDTDQPSTSSYIVTTTAPVTRIADSLALPFAEVPQQITMYARFIELGTVLHDASYGVAMIGGPTTSDDPRFLIYNASAGKYTAFYDNGTAISTSTPNATPAYGDQVETRAVLLASGAVQLGVSINGAAEVLASAGSAPSGGLVTAGWSAETIFLNSLANGAFGLIGIESFKILRGGQTLDTCRQANTELYVA